MLTTPKRSMYEVRSKNPNAEKNVQRTPLNFVTILMPPPKKNGNGRLSSDDFTFQAADLQLPGVNFPTRWASTRH